jgi:hypothetical protein
MMIGMKRLFATFAASTLLAASPLAAAPASAPAGPETAGNYYGCDDITTGGTGGYGYPYGGYGYGCCEYDEAWGGWYRNYSWGREACDPPYQAPAPTDRASQELSKPEGQ